MTRLTAILVGCLLVLLGQAQTLILNSFWAAGLSSTLNDNLVAYWKLDEASGTRNDSKGANHLTDNNTVTQAAGKIANAAQFTAVNLESLSITDNADLSTGDIDFTLAAWVYLDSKSSSTAVSKGNFDTDLGEYSLLYIGGVGDKFYWEVSNGTTYHYVYASTFGSPAISTWYLVVAWHDATADTINICVNNGAVDSAAHTQGSFDSTIAFAIGKCPAGSAFYWDGRVDEVGFWKRVLTAAERTELYNSGSGKTCCPF